MSVTLLTKNKFTVLILELYIGLGTVIKIQGN